MKRSLSLILAFLTLSGALAVAASAASSPFSDVAESRWSFDAIKYVYGRKYMEGVGGEEFSPAGTVTRAMAVTVLFRKEGSPAPAAPSGFSDVKDGAWYSDAVAWAKENGVVNGVGGRRFDPDGEITREQLAAVLYRYTALKGYDTLLCGDTGRFPDAGEVSGYAKDPMSWAVGKSLISGVKTGGVDLLAPRGKATREQFAAILQRYDGTYPVKYNEAVVKSKYTEKPYPLVGDADVYVSPDGDDAAEGSFERPVATFARAVELVRGLKESVTDRSVVVAFRKGEYHEENVTLTAEDSGTREYPVIYCGYGDGEAVITGGAIVTEDDFEPLSDGEKRLFDEKHAGRIKKADIGTVLPGYTVKDTLFGENGALWIARFPNKYQDGSDKLLKGAGSTVSENEIRISHPVMKKRVLNVYHTLEGLKLYGYLTLGWYKDTLDVDGYTVDAVTGDLDFRIADLSQAYYGRLRYGEFPWEEYHASAFLNMSEDLDAEGEYWVDGDTLTMYVYDPHGTYTFPVMDRGITLTSCDYVTFRGLTLTGYREKIFEATDSVGLNFDRCRFSVCSSGEAVTVRGRKGSDLDTRITGCEFSVFLGNAVNVNGGCGAGDAFRYNANYLFDNNRVTRANLAGWGAAVVVGGCTAAVLSHNEFENCAHMAIGFGEGNVNVNTVIEYNVFRNILYDNQDCGVISGGNSQADWGNKIRYNVFYPTYSTAFDRYAIYQDDNEPGAEIYGNLFFDTMIVIHDGRSNDVHDNVMIRSSVTISPGGVMEPLERYLETRDPTEITTEGRAGAFYRRWVAFFDLLDADPAARSDYFSAFPELAALTVDPGRADEPDFVLYPRNYDRFNWYFPDEGVTQTAPEAFRVTEGNRYFTPGENPCFVNPTAGDYTVVPGTGAPDVRFDMIGRY